MLNGFLFTNAEATRRWHTKIVNGVLKAFATDECAARTQPLHTLLPIASTPSAHAVRATHTHRRAAAPRLRSRKLFEVDFFARCAAKGLLPTAARHWNLGALAYFFNFACVAACQTARWINSPAFNQRSY